MSQRPEDAGVADQDVELAEALVHRGAEAVEAVEVAQVVRDQDGLLAAGGADGVVELFQRAHRARDEQELRALRGEPPGARGADAEIGSASCRESGVQYV